MLTGCAGLLPVLNSDSMSGSSGAECVDFDLGALNEAGSGIGRVDWLEGFICRLGNIAGSTPFAESDGAGFNIAGPDKPIGNGMDLFPVFNFGIAGGKTLSLKVRPSRGAGIGLPGVIISPSFLTTTNDLEMTVM